MLAMLGSVGVMGSLTLQSNEYVEALRDDRSASIEPEPIFSYPRVGAPDDVHERVVRDLLRRAVPGTEVHLTTYTLTRTPVARACLAAVDRGVDLYLLIDDHSADAAATQLLCEQLGDRVSITVDGAIGNNNNHNKFLLVEELATGESNVVWQSTSNFTNKQLYRHNTSVVFREDDPLYESYRDYWNELAAGNTDLEYNRTEETDSATVSFSPRSDVDTHLDALRDIVPGPDTTIRFMNSIWTRNRLAVVDRLAELIAQGATVEVILNEPESTVGPALRAADATVLEYPDVSLPGDTVPGVPPNVHSKNMLIDADFDVGNGTTERKRLVCTGSQNLSGPGLSDNDDTFLQIEDEDIYCAFLADWKRVHEQGVRLSNGEFATLTRSGSAHVRESPDCVSSTFW
ncbi:phospholipase D-like domain-containing protein [Natronolimnohabitans sp. A-GB9]|uniref:phospholipase D-like domain-containing protein n=1 Tax=Natronolimnohabitans sp. A-GB9 TaxID=3069757 RepID=UPI0027AEAB5B|nr:phospholipase D-like domain-containing protein [Natronolimnohabitans sp. A-GB9]MDQ2052792.1 phospholipase D-like domain-containing protein [Natronolimnohabitans sp. A-GB9]